MILTGPMSNSMSSRASVTARRWKRKLIPGARHSPHLEAKDATLAAIVEFVRHTLPETPRMIDFQTDPSRYRHWSWRSTDPWRP